MPAHGKDQHRCNGPDPIPVLIHLPMPTTTRRYVVTDDCGGTYLRSVHATLSTEGSSDTEVDVENITNSDPLMATPTTIDSGDTTSYSSATPHEMEETGTPATNFVLRGDVLEITASMGTGADDLTVLLEFGPRVVRVTP